MSDCLAARSFLFYILPVGSRSRLRSYTLSFDTRFAKGRLLFKVKIQLTDHLILCHHLHSLHSQVAKSTMPKRFIGTSAICTRIGHAEHSLLDQDSRDFLLFVQRPQAWTSSLGFHILTQRRWFSFPVWKLQLH